MATEKQIAANVINAQKSTGPRSLAGKQRSSQNAVKHGLSANSIIPGEDVNEYLRHVGETQRVLRPSGRVEVELARRVADIQWRMKRVPAYEKALLQWEAYLQAVEHDGINDDYDPGRNEPVDELAGTDADLADSLRLGRVLQSLLDRGVLDQLTRYERSLQRDLVSTLKLYHETQEARRERMKTTNGVPVHVPKTDRWIEGPDGRVTEAIDPP